MHTNDKTFLRFEKSRLISEQKTGQIMACERTYTCIWMHEIPGWLAVRNVVADYRQRVIRLNDSNSDLHKDLLEAIQWCEKAKDDFPLPVSCYDQEIPYIEEFATLVGSDLMFGYTPKEIVEELVKMFNPVSDSEASLRQILTSWAQRMFYTTNNE